MWLFCFETLWIAFERDIGIGSFAFESRLDLELGLEGALEDSILSDVGTGLDKTGVDTGMLETVMEVPAAAIWAKDFLVVGTCVVIVYYSCRFLGNVM